MNRSHLPTAVPPTQDSGPGRPPEHPRPANRQMAGSRAVPGFAISANSSRGAALVIVLGVLVLLLGLIVAFISRAGSERSSSSSYAASNSSRNLADLAVNLVQGQINDATSLGATKAWVSQPGAISVFSGNGSLENLYRLYSASTLTATNATDVANDLPPANWATSPAVWCDLNAPALIPAGSTTQSIWPILDPTNVGTSSAPNPSAPRGLAIDSAPGATTSQPAPMPVRWLYVLKDGTLAAPGNGTSEVTVPGASASNPITGRIAFWTDDDTCRVNVNTASEGTFWDTPRADTNEDRALAKYQPAQGEFQRYPGHPAMTSLSAVFPSLTESEIYEIVPRVEGGGSNAGTAVATGVLTPDGDRLYASVAELLYAGDRNGSLLTKPELERAKFVLTAHSRAPEINLFNLPRVAVWPVDSTDSTSRRTPYDRMIAHCATVNGVPYYFQRQDPKSATVDATIGNNTNLYRYLQVLTGQAIPGFGTTTFLGKYPDDRDQILTQIFDYIRSTNLDDSGLTEPNRFAARAKENPASAGLQPGFGQITPLRIGTTQGFGRFPSISEAGIQFIATAQSDDPATAADDESLGSNVAANKTLGGTLLTFPQRRIEAMLFFEVFVPGQGWPPISPAYTVRVRGANSLQVNGTSLGFGSDLHDLSFQAGGSIYNGRSWGGTLSHRTAIATNKAGTGGLPARGVMPADADSDSFSVYPFVGVPVTIDVTDGTMVFSGGTLTVDLYAGRSSSFGTPVQTYTFDFPAGTVLPAPDLLASGTPAKSGSGDDLPPATSKENWWTFSKDGVGLPGADTKGRIAFARLDPGNPSAVLYAGAPFRSEDVVRTLVPSQDWADMRLVAASSSVPSPVFVPHPDYTSSGRLVHSVSEATGSAFLAYDPASLVSGITWGNGKYPDIAIANANSSTLGDWDNGVSVTTDGAYINKPDEGNVQNISTSVPYYDQSHVYAAAGTTFFSPNRQMPSAGMFGSLPVGVKSGIPFRTLLFRAQAGHPGANAPADHLLMDLFWMPVVEPYAISEPFSTAGKINMNSQIAPFSYIKRQTALHALLKSEQVMTIPNADGPVYKDAPGTGGGAGDYRKPVDTVETLKQFDAKFASATGPRVFLSPTQITELHLVPEGQTLASMPSFWNTHQLSGDNVRERPYTNLVGRLTTKSNSYTVYFTAQALALPPGADQSKWNESKGRVVSEYRGSTSLERYIDPEDPNIPDYTASASPLNEPTLDKFYRWRVTGTRQFAP